MMVMMIPMKLSDRLGRMLAVLATIALTTVPTSGAGLGAGLGTPASDPVGIYALVDRVVFEPSAGTPQRIQIWGVFALADQRNGDNYQTAERGYLYYAIDAANERACRAEWSDLRAIAGTGQGVGFGRRYGTLGKVRSAGEAPGNPDIYPLGVGLVKLLNRHLGPTIDRELKSVPTPLLPLDGSTVKAGPIRLVTRNVADSKAQYVFEIEGPGGVRETSPPVAGGVQETAWSPRLHIRAGERYTWRVRITDGRWQGPAASAVFNGGQ